ncbi:MAG: hypothetical protein LIO96_02720 [Lachnospiraceae bacterium]|nr:hypothetical protein [Lachnospiraceae bacterium]
MGTGLLAETAEEPLVFETGEEVLVRHMDIQKVYLAQPEEDAIYEIYDREENSVPSFSLFQKEGENLQVHCLYCCFDQSLKTGTAVAKLSWKSARGKAWDEALRIALSDTSRIRISYGTAEGYQDVRGMKIEEDGLCFILEGGEAGIAPQEEFESMYVIRLEVADTGFFSGISLSDLRLSVSASNLAPDLVHVDGTDEEKKDNVLVFGESPAVYNEFYLVSEEVLGKAGADIRLEFDLNFIKIPLEDILSTTPIQWKMIMRKQTFVPDKEYDITTRQVVWEYFNGYGWTRLKVPTSCQTIFTPDDSGKGRRIRMEFTCPDDIRPTLVNSTQSFCIRARILKMNNAFKLKGSYVVPVAGQFFFSYDYATNPLSPAMVFRQNNMEMQRIDRDALRRDGYSFRLCDALPDQRAACYLGFEEPLTGGPLRMLFVLKDAACEVMPGLTWEYMGKKDFREYI